MKVDSGEIKAIAVLFGQQVSAITGQIAKIGSIFNEMIDNQDLSGVALETAKKYYEEIYVTVLQNISCIFDDTNQQMIRYQLDFCEQVEESVGVQIDTEELRIAEDKIKEEISVYRESIDNLTKQKNPYEEIRPLELFIMNAESRRRQLQEKREKAEDFENQHERHFSSLLQEIQHVGKLLTLLKNGIPLNADGTNFVLTEDQKKSLSFLKEQTDKRRKKAAEEAPPDIGDREWRLIEGVEKAPVLTLVPKGSHKATGEDIRITQEYQEWLLKYGRIEIMAEYATTELAYHQAIVNTGINPNTGQPVSDIEKWQSWSAILSTLSLAALSIYGPYKLFKGAGGGKVSGAKFDLKNITSLENANIKNVETYLDDVLKDFTKASLKKGDGVRYFDGKGNSWQLNYGYKNATDAIHGAPYLKTTINGKIIRIPLTK